MRTESRHPKCAKDGCERRAVAIDWCQAHDPAIYHRQWLSVSPLVEIVTGRGGPQECGAFPHSNLRRAYDRAVMTGRLSEMTADRLALEMLGLHPWEVWGDEWWDVLKTAEISSG